MIIDISAITEGHSTLERTTKLESVKDDLPKMKGEMSCTSEIDRTGDLIFMHLWFQGIFIQECSRCLNEFGVPISGDLRLTIKEGQGKAGPSADDESVDFYFDSQNFVDLSPAIYEEVMIALPLKPLCRADCKGIEVKDPSIQVALNGEPLQKEIDPRWEALKKLKETSKK